MKKKLRLLFSLILGFSAIASSAQADEKVKLSPGMLLRIWADVNQNAQNPGNAPSSAGIIDLAGDFSTERTRSIPQFESATSKIYGLEWAGYVRIDKEDTYVITTELTALAHGTSIYLYLKGNKVANINNTYGNSSKSTVVRLSPGYYPISLFTVQPNRPSNAMHCRIKIHPKSELDSEPLKVSDFYFRKK